MKRMRARRRKSLALVRYKGEVDTVASVSITQEKTLALISYAEERGWRVERLESGRPTFSGRPRFTLVLVCEGQGPSRHSLQVFIGSGRVRGVGRVLGLGSDYASEVGDWFDARQFLKDWGVPTEADQKEKARLLASYVAEDPGLLQKV